MAMEVNIHEEWHVDQLEDEPFELWLTLMQRGLIGPRTCRVFRTVYESKFTVLPTIAICALAFYLALWPDPLLERSYSRLVCHYIFGMYCMMFFFAALQTWVARRAMLREIFLEIARCSLTGPLRAGLRRGQLNANVFDPPSFCVFMVHPRILLILVGFVFRSAALFLWEGPGVAVWVLWIIAAFHEIAISPAIDFMMDILLALSDDLIKNVINLIQSYPDTSLSSSGSFWALVSREYRKMAEQLDKLWGAGAPVFWLRFIMTCVHMMASAVTVFAVELKKIEYHEIVSCLFALTSLMHCLVFVLRLHRISRITSLCMSTRATSGSIRIEALKHCGEDCMSVRDLAEYPIFLEQLSLTRCGVHVGVFIDKEFVVKLAVPLFTLLSTVFTFSLAKLGLKL